MRNESGLRPLGRAVLVEPYEQKSREGKIVIPETVQDQTRMAEQKATVIEVGPEAWKDESQPRARPGDRVMVSRYAGFSTTGLDGKPYRVVNSNDIFLGIDSEGH